MPDSQNPRVSVIVPTFNRAAFLPQAIDSALAQGYDNLEIVVVDDGSTDGTRSVLEPYIDRIRYVYQENQGAAVARNTAIAASSGEFIAFLDSDDIWLPGKLQIQMEVARLRPDIGMIASHAVTLDASGNAKSATPISPYQREGIVSIETNITQSPLPIDTLIVRRTYMPRDAPFRPGVQFFEDWEFCLRVAAQTQIWFVAQILAGVRSHGEQATALLASQERVEIKLQSRLRVLERVVPLLPGDKSRLLRFRSIAEAQGYAHASVATFVNCDHRLATSWLEKAIALDPDTWNAAEQLGELVAHTAIVMEQRRSEREAREFLGNVMKGLPPSFRHVYDLRSRIYGQFHAALSFLRFDAGEFRRVMPHVFAGWAYRPRLLSNRGLWSIWVRSQSIGRRSTPRSNRVE
ncbi:MAG: glycosyltransferase family A protein [Thermoflexales bacterium]